jgi:hypothetical protein
MILVLNLNAAMKRTGPVVGVQKAEGRPLRFDQPGGAGLGTLSDPDYPSVRRADVLRLMADRRRIAAMAAPSG